MALLSPVFMGGLFIGCDTVRRGGSLEVGHLFAGFQRHAGKLVGLGALSLGFGILVGIVMTAIVGASLLPFLTGGAPEPTPEQALDMVAPMLLAVLVVMAISIPVTMAFLFAAPLIVLNEAPVLQALKASFFACLKNILPFLVWGVVMLVLAIIAAIPLFLGYLLLVPVAIASIYLAYRDIFYDV
jgi:hypothetical protein